MAGFVMTLGGSDAEKIAHLAQSAESGVYGTFIASPSGHWGIPQEGTFADYGTMTPGDSIFFFASRKLFGIGRLTPVSGVVAAQNYPSASTPETARYEDVAASLLIDHGPSSVDQRWVCFFVPFPALFRRGVDMDEALESRPWAFRALRQMWGVSFIRVDDQEEQALKDVILRANLDYLQSPSEGLEFVSHASMSHERIAERLTERHHLRPEDLVRSATSATGIVRHEMALEADVLHGLSSRDSRLTEIFGKWDYVSHQVVASPHKPLQWADRMDVFGYTHVVGFEPTVERYLVAEIKSGRAEKGDIDQTMKYVDWLRDEFAHGDYSLLRAFLVASEFSDGALERHTDVGSRTYTKGRRPAESRVWSDLTLVSYESNPTSGVITYSRVS